MFGYAASVAGVVMLVSKWFGKSLSLVHQRLYLVIWVDLE